MSGKATNIPVIYREGRGRGIDYEDCDALYIKYSSHIPMTQKPSIATTILLCPFYRDLPKNKVHLGCALSIEVSMAQSVCMK